MRISDWSSDVCSSDLPLASARISGNSCVMAIDLNILLRAYAMGIFPMADGRDDPEIFWVEPKRRAILPLSGLPLSRSLRNTIRSDKFRVTADPAFPPIRRSCAEEAPDRPERRNKKPMEQ